MAKIGLIRGIVVLFFCISSTYAQKVKYKDLFGLLSTKQYDQAEPFLRRYLKDNSENPNAFLFMGIIFHEKANKSDILKQTNVALAMIDSAVLFYDKAYAMLTEKEVKRNDEYYQAYNRRDLRTGEFGVKLADIQFDLEKRKEALRERAERIKMVKYYFTMADSTYTNANKLFVKFQDKYPDEATLCLRYDEALLASLTALAVRFDSCTKMFDNYKSSLSLLGGKTGYNQKLLLNEITQFKTDGTSLADFYGEEIHAWDYKKFAVKVKDLIEKEIVPAQTKLISYDVALNKLREKLNQDSTSVRKEAVNVVDQALLEQLKKFDPDPLPTNIFNLKIADLDYRSSLLEHKSLRDSANVKLQVELIRRELKCLDRLDSIASKLIIMDLDEEALNYGTFVVNTFSNTIVLKSYVKALREFGERERRKKEGDLRKQKEALNWIVSGADSIPLTFGGYRSKYKPLLVVDDRYTIGLAYSDSLNATGYFYSIVPSRKVQVKASFPVDKASFKLSNFSNAKALCSADAAGQIFFLLIYSRKLDKAKKYPVTIAKIYKSDGLAWNYNYALPFLPETLTLRPDNGELSITGEAQKSVLDKNGKLMK